MTAAGTAATGLILAVFLAVAGVGLLRLAWARRGRTPLISIAGWVVMLSAALLAGFSAGAWGISVTALAGMTAAALLLGTAALQPGEAKGPREKRAGLAQKPPLYFGRRLTTVLLTVPGAGIASLCFAVAVRALAMLAGASEADANASALFAVPLAWSVLLVWMLMEARRGRQLLALAAFAFPALAALLPAAAG